LPAKKVGTLADGYQIPPCLLNILLF